MNNVVPITDKQEKKIEDELARQHKEAARAFNALYARWLRARANVVKPTERDDCNAECDKLSDLTWQIIQTPAAYGYQIKYKFEILLGWILAGGLAMPQGTREMVRSIQNDMDD
jgi:hypothetical protein